MKWLKRGLQMLKAVGPISISLVVLLLTRIRAFAASNSALQGFYSVTGGNPITQSSFIGNIAHVTTAVFVILTAVAGGWGMVYITWGGINMIHGGALKKQEAMERIKMAVIGLIVALCAGFIAGIAAFIAHTLQS